MQSQQKRLGVGLQVPTIEVTYIIYLHCLSVCLCVLSCLHSPEGGEGVRGVQVEVQRAVGHEGVEEAEVEPTAVAQDWQETLVRQTGRGDSTMEVAVAVLK